MIVLHCCYCCC